MQAVLAKHLASIVFQVSCRLNAVGWNNLDLDTEKFICLLTSGCIKIDCTHTHSIWSNRRQFHTYLQEMKNIGPLLYRSMFQCDTFLFVFSRNLSASYSAGKNHTHWQVLS